MSNIVSSLMVQAVNRSSSEKIPWYGGIAKWAFYYEPASKYKAINPNGPLLKRMKFAYWLCGIGFALGVGMVLLSKVLDHTR